MRRTSRKPGIPSVVLAAAAAMLCASELALAQFRGTPPDFVAQLDGQQEVPIRLTDASGWAQFRLVNLGATLVYKLKVSDIENVVAAHIHLGPPGVNGPVVAFLAGPFAPGGGPVSGVLAQGVIESNNLVGPLAGQGLSVLIEAMRTGGAYVNVHTNDGVDPADTGPGDFPGGEIRGRIKATRIRSPQREFDTDER